MSRLALFLIRPTKYDDDGYLLRHYRGVLPSNTLAAIHALTADVIQRRLVPDVAISTWLCDESVQPVPMRRIRRAARQQGTHVVVCLVGVQTSQFPRASDLALRFRALGITVLLGGFHVSGTLAMLPETPADLQTLLDAGVTLVAGEIETTWPAMLCDLARGTRRATYNTLGATPTLATAPVPRLRQQVLTRFVYRHFGTIDTSRGCPFACSFCTIINVQGRTMRERDPHAIAAAIEASHRATGTSHYFFTDDNIARNPRWRELFTELIRLREEEHIPLRFLMQVDLLAHRTQEFVTMAARAGCFQVFLGMESLNPASLHDGGKRQNRVDDYRTVIDTWRAAGVLTHVGYIIGFPHDSPASVREDLRHLRDTVSPDIASFFMLSPLPGSVDHAQLLRDGVVIDEDLNRIDTFHPVIDHPRMSRTEWMKLYQDAWTSFYDPAHLARQLARTPPAQVVTLLQVYLWYKAATVVEQFHPMMTGFVRLRPRTDRRPGHPVESLWRHTRRRVPEILHMLRGYGRVLNELRRLWLGLQPDSHRPAGTVRSWAAFARAMFGAGGQPASVSRRGPRTSTNPAAISTARHA